MAEQNETNKLPVFHIQAEQGVITTTNPQVAALAQQDELAKLKEENAKLLSALKCCASRQPHTIMESCPAMKDSFIMDNLMPDLSSIMSIKTNPAASQVYTIIVFGASGDLAKKKLYPSLFNLMQSKLLPEKVCIVGYARTEMSSADFRKKIAPKVGGSVTQEAVDTFLSLNFYVSGAYDNPADITVLDTELRKLERERMTTLDDVPNRFFYMALPPTVFTAAARALRKGAMATPPGWTRIVVEKPFGKDLESSRLLQSNLSALFTEDQLYRIDHYLGKEMVLNLLVLRFGNMFLQPLFNREHISTVQITFKEDIGTEGRGGYFDQFGIIRDVMQNHLIQILSLFAMECPVSLSSEDIRNEKVKVLRSIQPILPKDIVIGQFEGYKDDAGVPKDSICPTFAAAHLHINNSRWAGVPFILKCGKGLEQRKAEIRIQFKEPATFLFSDTAPNELVIRLQPDEAVYLKLNSKLPGVSRDLAQLELDLSLKKRFQGLVLPDAYEHLIRDVFRGDHSLFVREDELDVAWKLFTPILQYLESEKVQPIVYKKGTRGPEEADKMLIEAGYKRTAKYLWPGTASKTNP